MQKSFLPQIIKTLILIVVISSIFWFINKNNHDAPLPLRKAEEKPSITPAKIAIEKTVPAATLPLPTNEFSEVNAPGEGMESIPPDGEGMSQLGTQVDLSDVDLGGIDSTPTAEEKEQMMKFAPGINAQGQLDSALENGEDFIIGEGPGAGSHDINDIAPENEQP